MEVRDFFLHLIQEFLHDMIREYLRGMGLC